MDSGQMIACRLRSRESSWVRGTCSWSECIAHPTNWTAANDFEIDTTAGVNTQTIASVRSAWQRRASSPGALEKSTQNR
jgi:hypothetical protein